MKKVALITGGARGIGRAICLKMASEDTIVIINYNNSENEAKELMNHISKMGFQAEIYKCSITDAENLEKMFDYIKGKYSRLDYLINNAGIVRDNFLMMAPKNDIDNVLQTNIMGTMLCCKFAVPYMIAGKFGKIVNISSVSGIIGMVGQTSYSASKSAIIGFTRSLALELSKFNISVNVVSPGFIDTDMTNNFSEQSKKKYLNSIPMKRFGKPEEVAEVVSWLCSDKCSYITGQNIIIDGGMSVG